jgi:hypothetical protein
VDRAKKNQAIKLSAPAPSGIAQLRKSIDLSAEQNADPMNLDDFLVPTSIASPAGISPAPIPDLATNQHSQSAVPLNMRQKPHINVPTGMPASSVPKSSIPIMHGGEFDYVQKRVRKTSIDERRVSLRSLLITLMLCIVHIYALVVLGSYCFLGNRLRFTAPQTPLHRRQNAAIPPLVLILNRIENDQPSSRPMCLQ